VAWFLAFQVLAVLFFGSIFIGIGAACTNLSETQNFLTPVMMTVMLPMFVWFNVLRDPNSAFSVWLSLFPPTTPMLMTLRLASSTAVPIWQPLLGMGLVLLATTACVFAAGRIFRVGVLLQGSAPKFSELLRWVAMG
jgi:ABC-2 type transport system permease protein